MKPSRVEWLHEAKVPSNQRFCSGAGCDETAPIGLNALGAEADKIGASKLADAENRKPQPISFGKTTVDLVQHWFAKNAYVAMEAGTSFGKGGEGHMRVNTSTSRRTLKAALDSMADALKDLA